MRTEIERICRSHSLYFKSSISCKLLAYTCRDIIATSLRSERPLQVNLMIAGWSPSVDGPELFWLDRMGSVKPVVYSSHGKYSSFVLSGLDRHNQRRDLTDTPLHAGVSVVQDCLMELRRRTNTNLGPCSLVAIDRTGICVSQRV
jgi:20S proteasome subunit beta 4